MRKEYRKWGGADYIGSKDIDLGLPHVGALEAAQRVVVDAMGFTRLSFRYVRYLDLDTGRHLTADEVRTKPSYEIFPLYIDAMLPTSGEVAKARLGFVPPDEPLLAKVFGEEGSRTWAEVEGTRVSMPAPDILLAMKLNAAVGRADDHKRLKDVCDILALGLFSGKDEAKLLSDARSHCDRAKLLTLPNVVGEAEIDRAMRILNLEQSMARSVFEGLDLSPAHIH